MNVDDFDLPVTINPDGSEDARDQLNRVGMISCAQYGKPDASYHFPLSLMLEFQPDPGIYTRSIGSNPNNVSADQLIPVLCYWVLSNNKFQASMMFRAMMRRFGFAQNTHDGLSSVDRKQIPDFMALRAAPLFARWSTLRHLWDLYLYALLIGDWAYLKTNKDPVDINCTLVTFLTCVKINPTPISKSVARLWPKLRPNIYADLCRYHRAESGGNPEIAEMYKQIIEETFL
jgi:hypothetical protein